jgi:hypothetical protein
MWQKARFVDCCAIGTGDESDNEYTGQHSQGRRWRHASIWLSPKGHLNHPDVEAADRVILLNESSFQSKSEKCFNVGHTANHLMLRDERWRCGDREAHGKCPMRP